MASSTARRAARGWPSGRGVAPASAAAAANARASARSPETASFSAACAAASRRAGSMRASSPSALTRRGDVPARLGPAGERLPCQHAIAGGERERHERAAGPRDPRPGRASSSSTLASSASGSSAAARAAAARAPASSPRDRAHSAFAAPRPGVAGVEAEAREKALSARGSARLSLHRTAAMRAQISGLPASTPRPARNPRAPPASPDASARAPRRKAAYPASPM